MGHDCKIMCDGEEIATIKCTENGIKIEHTESGKRKCKGFFNHCCCE